jgi:hypothetical protein
LWGCGGFGIPGDAVRAWTSTVTASLTISFDVQDQNTGGGTIIYSTWCDRKGDGVIVYAAHNDEILGFTTIPNGGSALLNFTANVQQGDVLYFHLNMHSDNGYDSTYFIIRNNLEKSHI